MDQEKVTTTTPKEKKPGRVKWAKELGERNRGKTKSTPNSPDYTMCYIAIGSLVIGAVSLYYQKKAATPQSETESEPVKSVKKQERPSQLITFDE